VPHSAEALELAAREGLLAERRQFEAKQQLPAAGKNEDIAVQVASFTGDGGLLVYGVAEDEHGRPTVPHPIELAGAAERIDQVVNALVDEAPYFEVEPLPLADDASHGFLVVMVPQSARAPHQVAVKGEYRFYGRGDKGKRILAEGEIARLYRRREEWEVNADELLAECIARSPHGRSTEELAFMHGFVRPVTPDEQIWERAVERQGGERELLDHLRGAAHAVKTATGYAPALQDTHNWRAMGADAWTLDSTVHREDVEPSKQVRADVDIQGGGYLFCGRAAVPSRARDEDDPGPLLIFETLVAGNFAAFLAMLGALYEQAGYLGPADVGIAVTGLEGSVSYFASQNWRADPTPFKTESFMRARRVAAGQLLDPRAVTLQLLRRFLDTLRQKDYDPFASR
jgi:hypothetical protein